MKGFLAAVQQLGNGLVFIHPLSPTDPGYGKPDFEGRPDNSLPGWERPTDPGYGHGHPRPDRPDNGLPIAPVKPSVPIVLPPGMWPPTLPPGTNVPDNSLPPDRPAFIPPDPSVGIEQPIALPTLPPGTALLIALPQAAPKGTTPPGTLPAILVQSGKTPVLVYVTATPTPK